jgi:hypothetical protein
MQLFMRKPVFVEFSDFPSHGTYFNIGSEFLATDPEVLGSITGAARFSEKYWVWNGVHSDS